MENLLAPAAVPPLVTKEMDGVLLTDLDILLFWRKVDRSGDCWLWTGSKMAGGYGLFGRNRSGNRFTKRAHRVAYTLVVGPIPDGMFLLHACDTPACCNPAHLHPGTAKENSIDMVRKGRHWTNVRPENIPKGADHWTSRQGTSALPCGEEHANAIMTATEVVALRKAYKNGGISQRELARQFGVSQPLVSKIIRGELWASLKSE